MVLKLSPEQQQKKILKTNKLNVEKKHHFSSFYKYHSQILL